MRQGHGSKSRATSLIQPLGVIMFSLTLIESSTQICSTMQMEWKETWSSHWQNNCINQQRKNPNDSPHMSFVVCETVFLGANETSGWRLIRSGTVNWLSLIFQGRCGHLHFKKNMATLSLLETNIWVIQPTPQTGPFQQEWLWSR